MLTDKTCTCALRPNMSYQELMEEIFYPEEYCTSVKKSGGTRGWVCSNALAHLEKARVEERYLKYRRKSGQTGPRRRRDKSPVYAVALDIDLDGILG